MEKTYTTDTIKAEVKKYVVEELKNAKRAKELGFSALNCRAIAYGALQFVINILPDSEFEELNKWWQNEVYDEFTKLF